MFRLVSERLSSCVGSDLRMEGLAWGWETWQHEDLLASGSWLERASSQSGVCLQLIPNTRRSANEWLGADAECMKPLREDGPIEPLNH